MPQSVAHIFPAVWFESFCDSLHSSVFTEHSAVFGKPLWIRWGWVVWELHAENGQKTVNLEHFPVLTWHQNTQLTFAAGCDSATREGSPFTYWIRMHATGSRSAQTCCFLQNSLLVAPLSCKHLNYFTISSERFSSRLKSQVTFLNIRSFLNWGRVSDIWAPGNNNYPFGWLYLLQICFQGGHNSYHTTNLYSVTMWQRKSCQKPSLTTTINQLSQRKSADLFLCVQSIIICWTETLKL